MAAKKRTWKGDNSAAKSPLTTQEVRFCRLYAESGNATQAAEDAGYVSTDRVALAQRAKYLLKKPQISECVARMRREAADAEQVTVNRLAQSLGRQAFADRTRIFDADGRMTRPDRWPEELRSIVAGFEVEEETETVTDPASGHQVVRVTTTYKVKFERSSDAKRILASWLGMTGTDVTLKDVKETPLVVGGGVDVNKL